MAEVGGLFRRRPALLAVFVVLAAVSVLPALGQTPLSSNPASATSAAASGSLLGSVQAYAPIIAALATAMAALLSLYGVLRSNRRTIEYQHSSFERQLTAQREQLDIQLTAQREQLDRQLTAQRDQFDRQQDAVLKQNRQQAAQATYQELLTAVASALHSICWITWVANQRPERMTQARIDSYDAEVHVILPRMLGLFSSLTALDQQKAAQIRSLVNEVYELDGQLAAAGLLFATDAIGATRAMAPLNAAGSELQSRLAAGFEYR